MVEMETPVPGTYLLVDHSITRAFMKGALGQLVVKGPARPDLYAKVSSAAMPGTSVVADQGAPTDPEAEGKRVFSSICATCHQSNAMGLPGAFPPLAMSDYLNAAPERAIGIVLHGLSGKITVNNTGYELQMPVFGDQLSDSEISSVLTYVLNNFNNKGGTITPDQVKAARAASTQK